MSEDELRGLGIKEILEIAISTEDIDEFNDCLEVLKAREGGYLDYLRPLCDKFLRLQDGDRPHIDRSHIDISTRQGDRPHINRWTSRFRYNWEGERIPPILEIAVNTEDPVALKECLEELTIHPNGGHGRLNIYGTYLYRLFEKCRQLKMSPPMVKEDLIPMEATDERCKNARDARNLDDLLMHLQNLRSCTSINGKWLHPLYKNWYELGAEPFE